jgi:hypothetical protein
MGRYEEALPLFQRSLSIREQELGENHPLGSDHPNTQTINKNLMSLQAQMGESDDE